MDNRIKALVKFLSGVTGEPIDADTINDDSGVFTHGGEEYLVYTDKEADDQAEIQISECVWAFRPEFLASHSDCEESIFKILQDSGKCESLNEPIKSLIRDWDHFVKDAISADGRGHFLASYDSDEFEVKIGKTTYFIYRTN